MRASTAALETRATARAASAAVTLTATAETAARHCEAFVDSVCARKTISVAAGANCPTAANAASTNGDCINLPGYN
jgi:hypothetical protein